MVRYSDELIEEVRNSNDIVDVISQYVVLKRSGRNFFGLCPFHKEKSPSFSVSPDRQIFHCFGCGAGGNVIHFIQKIENIDFRETMEILAERAGIVLPTIENSAEDKKQLLKKKIYEINEKAALFFHENLYKPESKQAQEYIKKRKLDNKTLQGIFCDPIICFSKKSLLSRTSIIFIKLPLKHKSCKASQEIDFIVSPCTLYVINVIFINIYYKEYEKCDIIIIGGDRKCFLKVN